MRRFLPLIAGALWMVSACDATPRIQDPLPEGMSNAQTPAVPDEALEVRGIDQSATTIRPERLIPEGADVIGSWTGSGPSRETMTIAYALPSDDPFSRPRGVRMWQRLQGVGWLLLFEHNLGANSGVLSIEASTVDVTGDGVDDSIVFERSGGSGDCGTWLVLDPERTGDPVVYENERCDGRIDSSVDPVGLELTEAVFAPGDAHCCPSRIRTTILTYAGDGHWRIDSRSVQIP